MWRPEAGPADKPPILVRHCQCATDTAIALCFYYIRSEDTAFELCFHCIRGQDTAFTLRPHCHHGQNTAFALCFHCRGQGSPFVFPPPTGAVDEHPHNPGLQAR